MAADDGRGGHAGHWNHADAPASIAGGKGGHTSHDRPRMMGQEGERDRQHTGATFWGSYGYLHSGIVRGWTVAGPTAQVVGSTPMRG